MRKRIVFSIASLIAVLATPGCQESTTTSSTYLDSPVTEVQEWLLKNRRSLAA